MHISSKAQLTHDRFYKGENLLLLFKSIGICFICIMKEQPRNTGHFKKSKNVKEDLDNAIEQLDLIFIMQDPFAI